MARPSILVSDDLPFDGAQWAKLIDALGRENFVRVDTTDEQALASALETAEIAILKSDLDERFLNAPNLRWVHCNHAGLTKSARPEVFRRGLVVTGSAGRSGPALAEHVMMFSLMLCHGYRDFYEAQKRHEWRRVPEMADLRAVYGRTMGILGMGHTGQALAVRAKAFNMTVLGYRRRDLPAPEGVDRMYSSDRGEGIDEILEQADILALVLNLSDATHHMIGADQFARMKPGAFLVNLARGGIVDHDAMLAALKAGRLAGAGLDVTDPEPLPEGHPLWDMPNVLITPHYTAALPDKNDRSLDMIIENLCRYRAGEDMLNRISEEDLWTKS
ncbi:D-2-hydroxyacid dehydrogenase [Psychromarinibacter sp. C21-152]|uniref:D-2-hydroxyacid dehydrogenase n=1 Tax=Psychromarinibacter sediminicola TaxID=3033385 RepID=A0AAE3NN70_9RHOB|nr:D-2-hydroxyacid dehydrogenase [Psychromarinibacter sediminicola]MDF0600418.1 D-2-hydroxyacid dehydrogenase [Psychromarinibacter sediminicola]